MHDFSFDDDDDYDDDNDDDDDDGDDDGVGDDDGDANDTIVNVQLNTKELLGAYIMHTDIHSFSTRKREDNY